MPLKKLLFKPGVNRENTRYTTEGGWYDGDKVRFRQGTPEKIGGWTQISTSTFLGVCRSLWNWVTLASLNLIGVGTNTKFYIENGGTYNDITPERYTSSSSGTLTNPFDFTISSNVVTVNDTGSNMQTGDVVVISGVTTTLSGIPYTEINGRHTVTRIGTNSYSFTTTTVATTTVSGVGGTVSISRFYYWNLLGSNPFATVSGSPTITVTDANHGALNGDYVTFTGATTFNGVTVSGEYQIAYIDNSSYTIQYASNASGTGSGGGSSVLAEYQINTGSAYEVPTVGWGAGQWGYGGWGIGESTTNPIRLWSQTNFGQDLVFAPRGGAIYYWNADDSITTRGVDLSTLYGASDVPVIQNYTFVSDTYRFVLAFGCNDYTSTTQDPMLIRWSDQESAVNWTPAATNQAGSLRLSHGSRIVTAQQSRQEIVVWTDSSVYSLQYLGAGAGVFGSTLLGDNISIMGQNATTLASGVTYWMGIDKFYKYDGRVQTLNCDLRKYIFNDINLQQKDQIFAGTNEGFNEVWWFYCSASSTAIDKYVIYNYQENIWYYGTMARTAWLDSGLRDYPIAATYSYNIVNHEDGLDDNETTTTRAIDSYITTSEFDIDDGHNFGFVWRIVPDITFSGSTISAPQATMTLIPLKSSGSGYTNPPSVGGSDNGDVIRTATVPIEAFTQYVYIRVRGRQLSFKVESNQIGSTWQLGAPRIDIRPDGRR